MRPGSWTVVSCPECGDLHPVYAGIDGDDVCNCPVGGRIELEGLPRTSFRELVVWNRISINVGDSMNPKPARPRAVYQVTFTLEVALSSEDMERYKNDDDDVLVEEAVTALIDEELYGHNDGQTRCGLNFKDAHSFEAKFLEVKS